MKEYIIAGLDIGSSAVKVTVGQLDAAGRLSIIGGAEQATDGVIRGNVVSIEDAVASITKCLEKAERMVGARIDDVLVGVSGSQMTAESSKGIVATSKANGEIQDSDLERVKVAAENSIGSINKENVYIIPRSYAVDNQLGIKDPVGMSGMRLETDAWVVQVPAVQMKNLRKCVFRVGIESNNFVPGILATVEAVTDKKQRDLGVVVLDIGNSTTSLAVYEEGDLLLLKVLPVGSAHITNDIALCLRIPIDLAEKVKLQYGTALPSEVGERAEIDLNEFSENENYRVSAKEVAEIIEARVEEIFGRVDKELRAIGKSGKLPAGAILVGGGSKLKGMVETAKKELKLPVSIGAPRGVLNVIDKLGDETFTTAIGLVQLAFRDEEFNSSRRRFSGGAIFERVKKWFKALVS